jgi:hypothetical protein
LADHEDADHDGWVTMKMLIMMVGGDHEDAVSWWLADHEDADHDGCVTMKMLIMMVG